MGALLGLVGAVLIGKIAIGAAIGSLTVPMWVDLGQGAVTLVQLDAKLLKVLAAKHPHIKAVYYIEPPKGVCFTGAPSGWSAHPCP